MQMDKIVYQAHKMEILPEEIQFLQTVVCSINVVLCVGAAYLVPASKTILTKPQQNRGLFLCLLPPFYSEQ